MIHRTHGNGWAVTRKGQQTQRWPTAASHKDRERRQPYPYDISRAWADSTLNAIEMNRLLRQAIRTP